MTQTLITPAVGLAVSLEDARETLRLDGTALNNTMQRMIRGITQECEHQIGRALITQQWRLTLDRFEDAMRLANPPLVSIETVRYYDADNVLQTLDPADYMADFASEPSYVVPAPGKSWPATADRINAVMVDYTVGYGSTADDVPPDAQLYILARLGDLFDPATSDFKTTPRSEYCNSILDRLKVY